MKIEHTHRPGQLPDDISLRPGTPLACPFQAQRGGDTHQHLKKYRRLIWNKMQQRSGQFWRAFSRLKENSVLLCPCRQPQACPTEILIKAWGWYQSHNATN